MEGGKSVKEIHTLQNGEGIRIGNSGNDAQDQNHAPAHKTDEIIPSGYGHGVSPRNGQNREFPNIISYFG